MNVYYTSPMAKVINQMNKQKKSIILAGPSGSGKSVILKLLKAKGDINKVATVDCTVNEYIGLNYPDYFKLFHTALIVKKVLFSIQIRESQLVYNNFKNLENKVQTILDEMDILLLTNAVNRVNISQELLANPAVLFQELSRKMQELNLDITLIIDNFDNLGIFDELYQNYLYENLKKYFHFVITISDPKVVNNPESLANLNDDKVQVINANYSQNRDIIFKIICDTFMIPDDSALVNDEVIDTLIKESAGNISLMMMAFRNLLSKKKELTTSEYATYISNYFANLYLEYQPRERKLYINK